MWSAGSDELGDHFQAFEEALPDLLAGEPEVLRFEVESTTELER